MASFSSVVDTARGAARAGRLTLIVVILDHLSVRLYRI
jgi:hypothetical protein